MYRYIMTQESVSETVAKVSTRLKKTRQSNENQIASLKMALSVLESGKSVSDLKAELRALEMEQHTIDSTLAKKVSDFSDDEAETVAATPSTVAPVAKKAAKKTAKKTAKKVSKKTASKKTASKKRASSGPSFKDQIVSVMGEDSLRAPEIYDRLVKIGKAPTGSKPKNYIGSTMGSNPDTFECLERGLYRLTATAKKKASSVESTSEAPKAPAKKVAKKTASTKKVAKKAVAKKASTKKAAKKAVAKKVAKKTAKKTAKKKAVAKKAVAKKAPTKKTAKKAVAKKAPTKKTAKKAAAKKVSDAKVSAPEPAQVKPKNTVKAEATVTKATPAPSPVQKAVPDKEPPAEKAPLPDAVVDTELAAFGLVAGDGEIATPAGNPFD